MGGTFLGYDVSTVFPTQLGVEIFDFVVGKS